MRTANIHEAKTQLSRLVEAALSGEEVVIARNGVPAVKLVPVEVSTPRRVPGRLQGGKIVEHDPDWWHPDPEMADLFENGDPDHPDPLFDRPKAAEVNLLIDSHVLLWWLQSSRKLSKQAYQIIESANGVAVSMATPWELQIKIAASKLDMAPDWYRLDLDGIDVLSPTLDDVLLAANLPLYHRDPFDRLIIAQAMRRGMAIVTRDAIFSRYGVPIIAA